MKGPSFGDPLITSGGRDLGRGRDHVPGRAHNNRVHDACPIRVRAGSGRAHLPSSRRNTGHPHIEAQTKLHRNTVPESNTRDATSSDYRRGTSNPRPKRNRNLVGLAEHVRYEVREAGQSEYQRKLELLKPSQQ